MKASLVYFGGKMSVYEGKVSVTMAIISSKKALAVALSRLKVFENPKVSSEQYSTDSEIAAEVLWNAYYNRDIEGKVIVDLGCGTGVLGLGALLLGASEVFLVDQDEASVALAKENLAKIKSEFKGENGLGKVHFLCQDVENFDQQIDTVIENPPFGTKIKHADKIFLEKAFTIANVVYSFHKLTSKDFIASICKDHGYAIANVFSFAFPLKKSQPFHEKKIKKIDVGCWYLVKENP